MKRNTIIFLICIFCLYSVSCSFVGGGEKGKIGSVFKNIEKGYQEKNSSLIVEQYTAPDIASLESREFLDELFDSVDSITVSYLEPDIRIKGASAKVKTRVTTTFLIKGAGSEEDAKGSEEKVVVYDVVKDKKGKWKLSGKEFVK